MDGEAEALEQTILDQKDSRGVGGGLQGHVGARVQCL